MCEEKRLNEKEAEAVVGGVGTKTYKVPNVVGMTVMDAMMALDAQTFVAKLSKTGSQSYEAIVTGQSQPAGTTLAERSQIIIYTA